MIFWKFQVRWRYSGWSIFNNIPLQLLIHKITKEIWNNGRDLVQIYLNIFPAISYSKSQETIPYTAQCDEALSIVTFNLFDCRNSSVEDVCLTIAHSSLHDKMDKSIDHMCYQCFGTRTSFVRPRKIHKSRMFSGNDMQSVITREYIIQIRIRIWGNCIKRHGQKIETRFSIFHSSPILLRRRSEGDVKISFHAVKLRVRGLELISSITKERFGCSHIIRHSWSCSPRRYTDDRRLFRGLSVDNNDCGCFSRVLNILEDLEALEEDSSGFDSPEESGFAFASSLMSSCSLLMTSSS